MLRDARTAAIVLVVLVMCFPLFADTVSYSDTNTGAYAYEYTWVFNTTGSGATSTFWIEVHEEVLGANLVNMGVASPLGNWSYAGLNEDFAPAAGADVILWTGLTPGAGAHTFQIGSNVHGPGYSAPTDYTWDSNTTGGGTTSGLTHAPAPEPGTLLLFGAGLMSLTGWGYRRRRRK